MDILFLGTGAADWSPEPPRPDYAPGEWRGFTATLLAGRVLVDCGPTTPAALARFGVDPGTITDLFITHGHGDHYCLDAIAAVAARGGLRVHADPLLVPELNAIPGVQAFPLAIEQAVEGGPLRALPVRANHHLPRPGELAYHFLFSVGETTLFYALDGAWLPTETWLAIRRCRFAGVIWDATIGDTEGDFRIFEHNSIAMVRLMRATFLRQGLLAADAPVWLSHLARTLCSPHAQLAAALAPEGLTLAHDGLRATCQ